MGVVTNYTETVAEGVMGGGGKEGFRSRVERVEGEGWKGG